MAVHLGFIFVELPKLLRSPGSRSLLKKAAIWGTFLETPGIAPAGGPAELVALLDSAKKRMEAYVQLTPEVYNEIRQSMEHHDYVSVRAEALREGEAKGEVTGGLRELHKVAQRLKDRGVPAAEIAEVTGLPLADVIKL